MTDIEVSFKTKTNTEKKILKTDDFAPNNDENI